MTGSPTASATARTKPSCSSAGSRSRCGAEDDRPQVGLERLPGLEPGGLVGQPAFDVHVAGRLEPASRSPAASRSEQGRASRRRWSARARLIRPMLPAPPHWATSQPPGRGDGGEVTEERIVVGDPVEGRRREDGIDQPIDRQRSTEVGDDVLDPIPERARAARGRRRSWPAIRRGRRPCPVGGAQRAARSRGRSRSRHP